MQRGGGHLQPKGEASEETSPHCSPLMEMLRLCPVERQSLKYGEMRTLQEVTSLVSGRVQSRHWQPLALPCCWAVPLRSGQWTEAFATTMGSRQRSQNLVTIPLSLARAERCLFCCQLSLETLLPGSGEKGLLGGEA